MSGHNKWSQIKHQKGAADAKKGQLFGKIGKIISIAAKQGGSDPTSNIKLQTAIERAKAVNMPKDTIERAIKRATEKDEELFEITVKALTRSGIGLSICGITDNKNRTIGDIKIILAEYGAKMVEWIPNYPMPLDDDTKKLIEQLEENDDIKEVHTNENSGN